MSFRGASGGLKVFQEAFRYPQVRCLGGPNEVPVSLKGVPGEVSGDPGDGKAFR